MIEFPYGIADFRRIRQQGYLYLDRTAHIRDVEQLGSAQVFLRPRRFGKSLWLQTLASYYDLRRKAEFDELFGGLDIGRKPTPRAGSYFVLQWNFSNVSAAGDVAQIAENLRAHVQSRAEVFASYYEGLLPGPLRFEGSASVILDRLLAAVSKTPHPLLLLIDEYDNFVNEVMVQDVRTYRALFNTAGPYKELFKSVKSALEGQGMERAFVTGVSPIALNDLTSGFNNAKNVSFDPALATLCGFREEELRDLLGRFVEDGKLSSGAAEETMETMRTWYNGYRFSPGPPGREPEDAELLVYNPTNTLYFLEHLYRWGTPPRQLHDENLRSDRGKLAFLAQVAKSGADQDTEEEADAGASVVEELAQGDGEIAIPKLHPSFSVDDLIRQITKDRSAVASFLYYMGLLTLASVEPLRLRVPNLVVRKLLLDRLLEMYLPDLGDSSHAREVAIKFFQAGDLDVLLGFFEENLLPVLSNRDRGAAPKKPEAGGSGVNEMVVKSLFLSILFDDERYAAFSEFELSQGYADLCLLVRPERRRESYFDLLFEFKLVRRKKIRKSGQDLKNLDDEALRKIPEVGKALADARDQVRRYAAALAKRFGTTLNLRAYVVVAVGLERLVGEEVVLSGS